MGVAKNYNVADLQVLDGIFKGGACSVIGAIRFVGWHQIGDISNDE